MKLKLVKKRKEAVNTYSFFFEPEKKVDFLPGQYYYYTLPNLKFKDSRGTTRHFTIANSPTEGELLRLTTKLRDSSGYKKTLNILRIGDSISGEGPSGTFILDEHEVGQHILIAGGIGVTPFRSFIKYTLDKNLHNNKILLIYSNTTPEETIFSKELKKWSNMNPNIEVVFTITQPEKSKFEWKGLTGRVDANLVTSASKKFHSPKYWLCGPPGMVSGMENLLESIGISSKMVRSEKFTGY